MPARKLLLPLALVCGPLSCGKATPSFPSEETEGFGPDERGSELHRNIRRYLECKGLRCEERFPAGAEAVANRSPEFKDVWDTLALDEEGKTRAEYAHRLKPRKKPKK